MNTLAAKSPLNDNSTKSAGLKHRQNPGPKSVTFFTGTNTFIQTKSICPCDGGCPRCTGMIHPKLTIGQPNDKYEQEADRVADQIMRMPDPQVQRKAGCSSCGDMDEEQIQTKAIGDQITPLVQRQKDEAEKKEEEPVQAKSLANKELPKHIQTKQKNSSESSRVGGSALPTKMSEGSGQALTRSLRSFFEPRFGRNLSEVRIHSNRKAVMMAESINANAFTVGNDIYFNQDQFSPVTLKGKRLLAHELTHTLQQGSILQNQVEDTQGQSTNSSIKVSHSAPGIIQREVGIAQVESSATVLTRIQENNRAADQFITNFPFLSMLNLQDVNWVRNLLRLFYQARSFYPGTARDEDGNAFVYTCTGGWIDLGHFFISALVGYLFGYEVAIRAGWLMESPVQEFFYRIARSLDPSDLDPEIITEYVGYRGRRGAEQVDQRLGDVGEMLGRWVGGKIQDLVAGNARSYFTIEDLPSDHFGSLLGDDMRNNSSSLYDIDAYMTGFFSSQGAVLPTGEVLDALIEQTRLPNGNPRQHRSIKPLLLPAAAPLCPDVTANPVSSSSEPSSGSSSLR